jgi:hypothetical protein
LWDVGWGTRGGKNDIIYKISLVLWNLMLMSGIAYSIYRLFKKGGINSNNLYFVVAVASIFGVLIIGYICYYINKCRFLKKKNRHPLLMMHKQV